MVIKMKLVISRDEFLRKGEELIVKMATSSIDNDEFGLLSEKHIITECKSIKINGIQINATAFTVGTNWMLFGEIEEHDVINGTTDKKIGTRYAIDKPVAEMRYGTIKTLSFEQEIGTSGKTQTISIYIKDNYNRIKEMLEEIN